ncbi:MAG: leucine-rich repeat domain-containing protein [Bacteroidaceae bacterium]|nr:leucine-rich repeat domain-containing protein [Bacteroidaceae bacterium]
MKNYLLKPILLLAVLFSATSIHAHDFSAVNEDGVTIYYKIISTTDRTCEVTYQGTNYINGGWYSGSINIPESVIYSSIRYKVIRIGEYAFWKCQNLTAIKLSDFITVIGQSAFAGSTSLTSVIIPDSVKSIGNGAFSGCSSLVYAKISNSVSSLGWATFSNCYSLSSVFIPNSVKNIGGIAFANCNFKELTISNFVNNIGEKAFFGCSKLGSVTIVVL